MKNDSQSGVSSYRAEDARRVDVTGVALDTPRPPRRPGASKHACRRKIIADRWRPSADVHLEQVAQVVQRRAVSPRRRCCSTDAGSVSPWMTISRCRSRGTRRASAARRSSPFCSTERDAPVAVALREEHAPAGSPPSRRERVRPALAAHGDGRCAGRRSRWAPGPSSSTRLRKFGCQLSNARLQPRVARQVDVVGDLLGVVDAHESTPACGRSRACGPCRSGAAPVFPRALAARRSSSARP